jgi:hypothetical protein
MLDVRIDTVKIFTTNSTYGSFLCLVYATSHLLFGGFCSYLVERLGMIWACAYYTDFYWRKIWENGDFISDFWQCGQKKIVYADILYFVEHVFSWNVACERGKPPEGAIASFYSTCYIKIWIPSVD